MKISINWNVNVEEGRESLSLEELNCNTIEEFNALSYKEQQKRCQDALNDHPSQPFMVVTSFELDN